MNTPAISSNNNLVNNENSSSINSKKRNPRRLYSSMASNLSNEPITAAVPQSNPLVYRTLPKNKSCLILTLLIQILKTRRSPLQKVKDGKLLIRKILIKAKVG